MKTEEWKAKLMDYLYDELDPQEKEAFEKELEENPDLQQELKAFQEGKDVLGSLEDENVTAPPFFNVNYSNERKSNQHGYKWFMSIAATFLILLLAARFTGLEVSSTEGEFRIALGQNEADRNSFNEKEMKQMVNLAVSNYEEKLDAERADSKEEIESFLKLKSQQNQKLINEYLSGLQKSNLQMMQAYWKESSKQQQTYTENLLSDFADYMEEQRKEDMDYLFAKMELMESDKDLFKIETGQLINSLASNQAQDEEQAF